MMRVKRALSRPDLVLRKLRGQSVIDIELDEIAPFLPEAPIILEAGALNGADTVRFAERWPHATVHACEPVPAAYLEVARRTRGRQGIHIYEVALGDTDGRQTMVLDIVDDPDQVSGGSSSLLTPTGHLGFFPEVVFSDRVDVDVVTLDTWARQHAVDRLDLAWLDLQGMELPVLQAAPEMVGRIGAVCLEVAKEELYAGSALYSEIVTWMGDHGFRVAIDRVPVIVGNMLFVRRVPLEQ